MNQILFKTEKNITNQWLDYFHSEATALSQREEFAIENYADRELLNPDMSEYLSALPDSKKRIASDDIQLNFHQNMVAHIHLLKNLKERFSNLKNKIRKVFCKVVGQIKPDKDFDWKTLIKAVLIALIPVFAGGIPAIALPLIVALIAKLIKLGMEKVCPA